MSIMTTSKRTFPHCLYIYIFFVETYHCSSDRSLVSSATWFSSGVRRHYLRLLRQQRRVILFNGLLEELGARQRLVLAFLAGDARALAALEKEGILS